MSLTYLYYITTDTISQYKFLIISFKDRKNYLLPLLSFIFMIMGIVYLDVNILFSTFLLHLNSYHIDDKLL